MLAPSDIHSNAPVPGHQHVLVVSVASSSLACSAPRVLCMCLPTGFEDSDTPKMENAFNFYVDFYFKYAGLNALEFILNVSSHLFFNGLQKS